ncbi:MAG: type II toxin-antitoxin system death-on-curing family toxin [Gammaproteobacteria bacterium]|nr:type II toxin-antitoxin system death-on-curing family toxin [Gammaproteobacteria bacterium]
MHYQLQWEDLIYAHEVALQFGGARGVINKSSLASAINRPYSGYLDSIHEKAAALVESVVRNHGFADANKRTAVLALGVLIARSGYRCTASNDEMVKCIVGVAAGTVKYDDLLKWFKNRIVPKS